MITETKKLKLTEAQGRPMAPNPLHLSLDQLQQLADDATKNREALEIAADEAARTSQRMADRAKEAGQHERALLQRLEIAKALKAVRSERAAAILEATHGT